MKNKDYKFKSSVTLQSLPYGVTLLSEIDKKNISDLMKQIVDKASKVNWIEMAVTGGIIENHSWNATTAAKFIDEVRDDLTALKGKLR